MDTITQLLEKEQLIFGEIKDRKNINHRDFPVSFHLQCLDKLKQDKKSEIQTYNLNDSELLSILLLMGSAFSLINGCLYTDCCDDLERALHECLDSALLKLPKCTTSILYRQDRYWKIEEITEKQIIKIPAYFTTSLEDYENTTNIKWIITPLNNELTKAHNLFEIYDPGDELEHKEWQVNFERNTEFVIDKIEKRKIENQPDVVFVSEKNAENDIVKQAKTI